MPVANLSFESFRYRDADQYQQTKPRNLAGIINLQNRKVYTLNPFFHKKTRDRFNERERKIDKGGRIVLQNARLDTF